MTTNLDDAKRQAAQRAFELVKSGMRLGLGTGSTAAYFVDILGQAVAEGLSVLCVPTSEATRAQAERLSIPLTTLDETPMLDLTVDGADECDAQLRLIKGGGGALLREKIVANASKRLIIIADESKFVDQLGRFPLPIEVVPFGLKATEHAITRDLEEAEISAPRLVLRMVNDTPFLTDGGHYILDAHLNFLTNPEQISNILSNIPGVVDHGLFLNLADAIILASSKDVRILGTC